MIYAQITNNIVMNTIQIDDETLVPTFAQGYDYCIRIDCLSPQPAIGWSYDGTNFANQAIMPAVDSYDGVPTGTATTFAPFVLSDASGGYTVSVNGSTLSIGCQNYDYAGVRYVLYMLLEQDVGSIGSFTEVATGIMQNNRFIVTQTDANLIYNALCTLT